MGKFNLQTDPKTHNMKTKVMTPLHITYPTAVASNDKEIDKNSTQRYQGELDIVANVFNPNT